jgi:hypothetical protein
MNRPPCALTGCDKPTETRGLCRYHYERRRIGRLTLTPDEQRAADERRAATRAASRHGGGSALAARRGGGSLPIGPFRGWLIAYATEYGDDAINNVIAASTRSTLDVAKRKRYRWLHESDHIALDTVDRVTLGADGPDLLRELYPLNESAVAA